MFSKRSECVQDVLEEETEPVVIPLEMRSSLMMGAIEKRKARGVTGKESGKGDYRHPEERDGKESEDAGSQSHFPSVKKGNRRCVTVSVAIKRTKHHRKECSASLSSRELQIKTAFKLCLTLLRSAVIKKTIQMLVRMLGKNIFF